MRFARAAAAVWIGWQWVALLVYGYRGDAVAYWSADLAHLYDGASPSTFGAFLYAPPIAQLLQPLRLLPWDAFYVLWTGAQVAILVWLAGPFLAAALFWQGSLVWGAVASGNIALPLAALIVAGFRWPGAWAGVLPTKVTPGVGLLWFVRRREWRALALALGTTAALAAVSVVWAPRLWLDWLTLLAANTGTVPAFAVLPVPVLPRLLVAAALVWVGAGRGWRWTVPLAALLALPYIAETMLPLALGAVALQRKEARPHPEGQERAAATGATRRWSWSRS